MTDRRSQKLRGLTGEIWRGAFVPSEAAGSESIKGRPEKGGHMNLPLQAFQDSPGIVDASGWAVLIASLVVTVGWLWYLYR
ncbi:MAG: hypothetical protein ACI8U4_000678 [Natronomonas sp.]|jgi:hypothetical protein